MIVLAVELALVDVRQVRFQRVLHILRLMQILVSIVVLVQELVLQVLSQRLNQKSVKKIELPSPIVVDAISNAVAFF
jgi:hypothetical protein